jgi:leader peptidase (prepilin peptidase)/N-methyltransferase
MIELIFVFIFGAVVGSFLNVCIHRMPLGESVVWPRSHCPHCKKRIPGYDNIPFLSYMILGGRCRICKKKISLRYPAVELLTAAVFLLFYNYYGLRYEFFFYSLLACNLIVATFVDIKHRIIPDEISVGGIIIGFLLSSIKGFNLNPMAFDIKPMLDSGLGIIAGGGSLYLTGFFFDLVYFKLLKKPPIQGETESMGGGDVKLLAMIGAFLGWKSALVAFILAPFFGAVIGIIQLVTKKDHTIPYGPFLSLAAFLSIFWTDAIIKLVFYNAIR